MAGARKKPARAARSSIQGSAGVSGRGR
jgi:hypothetical protein